MSATVTPHIPSNGNCPQPPSSTLAIVSNVPGSANTCTQSGASTTAPAAPTPPPGAPVAEAPLPRVPVPARGRALSEFAAEVGSILSATGTWFLKDNRAVVLRETNVAAPIPNMSRGATSTVFHYPTPTEFRSMVEKYLRTVTHEGGNQVVQSMGRETAAAVLESPQFKAALPRIDRILDVPIPIEINGRLEMIPVGYDARFGTFCRSDAGSVTPLPLEESKLVITEMLEGFPFTNDLSRTLAIARMVTPMCKGLMGWTSRTPLWVFEANRPRAGKDYLAGCCGILYEGRANEDAPLDHASEETLKRIIAALQSGRRFMHFANTSGDIKNDVFEQAVTGKDIRGRLLGSNSAASDLTLPNELEFSVSGNTGFTFSEDFALRCRRISLAYYEEDANGRTFPKPDLHGWILQNRARILGAFAGLIWEWDRQGRPAGPSPFTSFPEWARCVGGILHACGLGDPCLPQFDGTFTKDTITEDMTTLFDLVHLLRSDDWVTPGEIRSLISGSPTPNGVTDGYDLFPTWNMGERPGQTAFGTALLRYKGRVLGGIKMEADTSRRGRKRYRFVREEEPDASQGKNPDNNTLSEGRCEPCEPCEPKNQTTGGGSTSAGVLRVGKQVHTVCEVHIPPHEIVVPSLAFDQKHWKTTLKQELKVVCSLIGNRKVQRRFLHSRSTFRTINRLPPLALRIKGLRDLPRC